MILFSLLKAKHIVLVLLTILLSQKSNSQGGWDINYLPINVVDESYIGREIRVDFRQSLGDILNDNTVSKLKIRELLYRQDSITLKIRDVEMVFTEKWLLYPDQGLMRDQYLVSETLPTRRITKVILKKVSHEELCVEMILSVEGEDSSFMIRLDKDLIKGILISSY